MLISLWPGQEEASVNAPASSCQSDIYEFHVQREILGKLPLVVVVVVQGYSLLPLASALAGALLAAFASFSPA